MERRTAMLGCLLIVACASENGIVSEAVPEWPDSNPPEAESRTWTDRVLQLSPPEVDVLWVIDNSSSMEDEQGALIEHFPFFADYFVASGTDYHIGVISTDIYNPEQNGTLHGVDGVLWIDDETVDPIGQFDDLARLGITGSGDEAGLGAIYRALEEKVDTVNAGFRRPDAALHTVVITDEEDQTPPWIVSLDEFVAWYRSLAPEDEISFNSIVSYTDEGAPDPGLRYLYVTDKVGGVEWDIMDPAWDTVLDRLGVQAAGERLEFFLSHRPILDTLTVYELLDNGVVILHEEAVLDSTGALVGGAWTFSEVRNSVSFVEYVPAPGSALEISYTLLAD